MITYNAAHLVLASLDVNFDVFILELMAKMWANAGQSPKPLHSIEHRNFWTLKLVKISLKFFIQLHAVSLRTLKPGHLRYLRKADEQLA